MSRSVQVIRVPYDASIPSATITEGDWQDVSRKLGAVQGVSVDWYSSPADAADAAGPGGTVIFTEGQTYAFDTPIPMQSGQRFAMNGAILQPTGESAFKIKSTSTTTRKVSLEGGEINGGNTAAIGIDFRGLVDSSIDSVWVRNRANYGVYFGGTHDIGGWSNRLTRSRLGTVVNGAAVYMAGKNSVNALNANNNLLAWNVIQCNGSGNGYGIHIAEGGENRLIANDIGYGASTGLVLGAQAINTYSAGNRYEKPAGAIRIEGGSDNVFDGDFYGTPDGSYTGHNVTIVSGDRNEVRPAFASAGSQPVWIQIQAGSGNVGILSGVEYHRTATSLAEQSRTPGDTANRFQRTTAGTMQWGPGNGVFDIELHRFAADTLRLAFGDSFLIEGGGWNNGHLQLGTYHLWVDGSGRLRIKDGAPTSSTDGTVVGGQS